MPDFQFIADVFGKKSVLCSSPLFRYVADINWYQSVVKYSREATGLR